MKKKSSGPSSECPPSVAPHFAIVILSCCQWYYVWNHEITLWEVLLLCALCLVLPVPSSCCTPLNKGCNPVKRNCLGHTALAILKFVTREKEWTIRQAKGFKQRGCTKYEIKHHHMHFYDGRTRPSTFPCFPCAICAAGCAGSSPLFACLVLLATNAISSPELFDHLAVSSHLPSSVFFVASDSLHVSSMACMAYDYSFSFIFATWMLLAHLLFSNPPKFDLLFVHDAAWLWAKSFICYRYLSVESFTGQRMSLSRLWSFVCCSRVLH